MPSVDDKRFTVYAESCQFVCAADADSGSPATFKAVVYTGRAMRVHFWAHPVVIDLAALRIPRKSRPVNLQHGRMDGVGHTTDTRVESNKVISEGVVSRATGAAQDVVQSAQLGYPWQASIEAYPYEETFVAEGESKTVNGREQRGPCYILKCEFGGFAFVDLGADEGTSAKIAAQRMEVEAMPDKDENKGKTEDTTVEGAGTGTATVEPPETEPVRTNMPSLEQIKAEAGKAAREAALAEHQRIAAIRERCVGNDELIAKCIANPDCTPDQAELEHVRATRAKAPAVHVVDAVVDGAVLEAACLQSAGARELDKAFDGKTLDAAQRRFPHGIGLAQLLLEAAWANGYRGRSARAVREILISAFPDPRQVSAGFSGVDISGILSNVANKFLLDMFMATEQVWREIARVRSVSDFKQITSYRLTAGSEYEEVGPAGEIKHGDLGEESFTNQAKTYAKMFALTRQDIINDDLGALTSVPAALGWGAGLKLNKVFWTKWLDDAAFFTAGLLNYFDGAATLLQLSSLETAVKMFRQQVDAKGNRIALQPDRLLAPPDIEGTARQLYESMEYRDTTASTVFMTTNVWRNRFRPLISAYLSDSGITGYSATAWYLLCDPRTQAPIEVCFLNGKESPTVEQADADFNTLGIQMRGYHDFGVNHQEHRAAVKSKGAA